MTTLAQSKPQPQPQPQQNQNLDAVDGEFDYLIGLRPQNTNVNSDYYKGYEQAALKNNDCPF